MPNWEFNHINGRILWLESGIIIVAGGDYNGKSVECIRRPFDLETDSPKKFGSKPRRLADMHEGRKGFGMTEFRGKILVAGGYNLSSVEIFTPPSDKTDKGQWTLLRAMPEKMQVNSLICAPPGLPKESILAVGKQ